MHSEAPKPSCRHRVDTAAGRICSLYARGPDHGFEKCWDDRENGTADHVKLIRLRICPNYKVSRIEPEECPITPEEEDAAEVSTDV